MQVVHVVIKVNPSDDKSEIFAIYNSEDLAHDIANLKNIGRTRNDPFYCVESWIVK